MSEPIKIRSVHTPAEYFDAGYRLMKQVADAKKQKLPKTEHFFEVAMKRSAEIKSGIE